MIPALPGILTTKQKKSRPGSPSWAAAYFHIFIIPSILNHRQDGDDNKTPVAGRKTIHGLRVAPTIRLCRVKFIPFVINSGYVQDSQRYALWASPTVSHRGDENNKQAAVRRWQPAKKSTAYGLVRRGFHVGSPLERFRHSLAEYDGGSLQTTSYGLFSDSDAASPRQTQTNNDASGNPLRVAGAPRVAPTMRLCRVKFIPFVINSGYLRNSQRYARHCCPFWQPPCTSR